MQVSISDSRCITGIGTKNLSPNISEISVLFPFPVGCAQYNLRGQSIRFNAIAEYGTVAVLKRFLKLKDERSQESFHVIHGILVK